MARLALGAALALAATSTWWWWSASRAPQAPAAPAATAAAASAQPPAAPPAPAHRAAVEHAVQDAAARAPRLWKPPASLDGTRPDGAFGVDASGELIVSADLRRAFEYWFAASGEEPDEQIAARLAAEIRARLDDPAEAEALALLARFLRYRERGRALAAEEGSADLERRAAALRALRREVFGADAEALFADEEALVAFTLAERRLASDPALSDAERAAHQAELLAAAPESVRAARAALLPAELARDEAVLRARGGGADDVQRLREERVGAAAAERLAALDAARAAWRARIATYRAERTALDADPAPDPAARANALAALRARHFSGPELQRIDALDRHEMEEP